MTDLHKLSINLKTEANRLGFKYVGITPALPVPHFDEYVNWVNAGKHAGMAYLKREDALAKRGDPRNLLPGCQRVICLAMPYPKHQKPTGKVQSGQGLIAAYATIPDYHVTIQEKLGVLENWIREQAGSYVGLKSYVDTGPILERAYAVQAGLGMVGKNGCLIIPGEGSYFFLAEILTDLPLPTDQPFTHDLCKNCHRCIDACPTHCIEDDHTIDAGRCISYLTIENKGTIPDDLKGQIGDWFFGCDVCQAVCPHNHLIDTRDIQAGKAIFPQAVPLIDLFNIDEATFTQKFRDSSLFRAKRRGLLRNAAIVLGNQQYQPALNVLEQAIKQENDPIIIDACRWAIEKIKGYDDDPSSSLQDKP